MKKLIIIALLILPMVAMFGQTKQAWMQADSLNVPTVIVYKGAEIDTIYPGTIVDKLYIDNVLNDTLSINTAMQDVDTVSINTFGILKAPKYATNPIPFDEGQILFDSVANTMKYYNGTTWISW